MSDETNDTLKIEGDNAQWVNGKPEGIFGGFLSEANPSQINHHYQLANEFLNEIVPYSLQHFLGVAEGIVLEDDQEDNGEEDDEEESDEEEE